MSTDESRTRSLRPPEGLQPSEDSAAPDELPAEVAALARVYDACSRRCWSMAKQLLGNDEQARAVVIDVFRQLGSAMTEDAEAVCTWLMAQIHRTAVAALRQGAERPPAVRMQAGVTPDMRGESAPGVTGDPPLGARLDDLPAVQRSVIVLAYFGGYTTAQIAAQTGAVVADVQRQMSLGLRSLRPAT